MPEFRSTSYAPDNLLAGEFPRVAKTVTIKQGQNLAAGSVLGRVTADNEFILSAAAAVDGSEVPLVVLADAVDATAAPKEATVWLTGQFNQNKLVLGAGHTVDSVFWGLAARGIFITPTTEA